MDTHILSPDTQAILLLCGTFGSDPETKPLTITEYSQLAQWLLSQGLRPADLLQPEGVAQLTKFEHRKITRSRLQSILKRGGSLALAIEHWTNKGLWIISRSDTQYPKRLKDKLKHLAPPILYGAGNIALLSKGGLSFVGSRNVDEHGIAFTREVASMCVREKVQVISGGAKGVDTEAMLTALSEGGQVVGVLGHSLAQASLSRKYRQGLQNNNLVLISPYNPEAGFSVGTAMARNKYVYTLSDACLVVSSDLKGGTWNGANENLKNFWVPLLVREDSKMPKGNKKLIELGATAVDLESFASPKDFFRWLNGLPLPTEPAPTAMQTELFDLDTTSNNVKAVSNPPQESAPPVDLKVAEEKPSSYSFDADVNDLFEIVWPYFERVLVTPKKVDELAKQFNLNKSQTRDWLQKASELGKVTKLSKPVRYQLTKPTLFEEQSSRS
jgi:predicted Rossmann fold nucleotide-binding protein DprA/Smf involved in DNA uptake